MGGMQIMLDKGEENDWFSSNFICFFPPFRRHDRLVWWEWRQKDPLINLKLFRYKNFAICCFLMMLVGGVLNANTVLQPQFMQQLLGWTATTAGSPSPPAASPCSSSCPWPALPPARFRALPYRLGFTPVSSHLPHTRPRSPRSNMTFAQASWLRVVQMMPLPFCFISITTAAYVGMPKEDSNQVAGLINFARNIGGSILIAITNAQVTSRTMWHQQHLQSTMTPASIAYQQHVKALTGFFGGSFGGPNGAGLALASIYNQLNQPGRRAGLPGRLHGAVLHVDRPGRAGLPAEQEQARRRSRYRSNRYVR
jgi:MFS transporter, DHA2 family, multidrug resistance protein